MIVADIYDFTFQNTRHFEPIVSCKRPTCHWHFKILNRSAWDVIMEMNRHAFEEH